MLINLFGIVALLTFALAFAVNYFAKNAVVEAVAAIAAGVLGVDLLVLVLSR